MSLKKLLTPFVLVSLLFTILGVSGLDPVVLDNEQHKVNLRKYYETQFKILRNYVNPVDESKLFHKSVVAFVKALDDSTLVIAD
jgi:hypothetical protein